MAITVDVIARPDFSAFRTPTAAEIADAVGCSAETAEKILECYTVLPR